MSFEPVVLYEVSKIDSVSKKRGVSITSATLEEIKKAVHIEAYRKKGSNVWIEHEKYKEK